MYGVETLTPPASPPLTAAAVRDFLRLNDAAEDALLADLVAAAAEQFEHDTGRPVLATVYRQHVTRWPRELALGRGGVTAVGAVRRYLADGTDEAVTGWAADLVTPPARVVLSDPPALVGAGGRVVSPAGYVEFTAGWPSAAAVPRLVMTALKLLVGHWYEHREAFAGDQLRELPHGWASVCGRYRLGLSGDWGQ